MLSFEARAEINRCNGKSQCIRPSYELNFMSKGVCNYDVQPEKALTTYEYGTSIFANIYVLTRVACAENFTLVKTKICKEGCKKGLKRCVESARKEIKFIFR